MARQTGSRAHQATSSGPSIITQRYFDSGRDTWPEVTLGREAFERYFARHLASGVVPAERHAADMYLACACAHGIDSALASFERTFIGDMSRAVASVEPSRAFVQEILQATREKLLVCKVGDTSKIADYAGRASLRTWLSAIVIRTAISHRRKKGERGHRSLGAQDDARLAAKGPEFEYLRGRYKTAFEDAVRDAIEKLPAKDRMLLRLNLVDGMSIDAIATAYNVGRSTAARWLAGARQALLKEARRGLRKGLHLTSTELDSLAGAMRSQLEVSVLELLAEPTAKQS